MRMPEIPRGRRDIRGEIVDVHRIDRRREELHAAGDAAGLIPRKRHLRRVHVGGVGPAIAPAPTIQETTSDANTRTRTLLRSFILLPFP